ncbi:MBL fold metallo-hydrolase [Mesobacillus stamsii]|uniref:L-ascorbate metabolism protein UlaG (Beta-lactamase superfamily) n=1 Tax=Mesobacillus stamsii TaxID=225347 RepID=A0ABU0FW30_9BACI|nr:MBL fold metallo-hydrolase [Mesobacillus stamsii]MDQ0414030.1 L-ascorbate metabolism protein UlaG (beta-lactamase superfamily) [Mesobacillus stamsii]
MIIYILFIFIGIIGLGYAVVKIHPTFGGKQSKEKMELFAQSPQYQKGKFINLNRNEWDTSFGSMLSMIREFLKSKVERKPRTPLSIVPYSPGIDRSNSARVTWFGHSAFMLEVEGKTILFDPMFGKAPTPFPIKNQRYSRKLPFKIEDLPAIDAVVLSHDHYDHLDYGSIMNMKEKVKQFITPLGVGSHLARWGIPEEKISEHDWWNEYTFEGLKLACTPARHFSGRGLADRNSTLWCSWVIIARDTKIYFSGDGGYGSHFKEIGEKYGPFDLTLMECGQYDVRWADIHMLPEETVQAHQDVKGKLLLPVHWGAFTLSLHAWHDPIERAVRAAEESGVEIATPRIGETVIVGEDQFPDLAWWRTESYRVFNDET